MAIIRPLIVILIMQQNKRGNKAQYITKSKEGECYLLDYIRRISSVQSRLHPTPKPISGGQRCNFGCCYCQGCSFASEYKCSLIDDVIGGISVGDIVIVRIYPCDRCVL